MHQATHLFLENDFIDLIDNPDELSAIDTFHKGITNILSIELRGLTIVSPRVTVLLVHSAFSSPVGSTPRNLAAYSAAWRFSINEVGKFFFSTSVGVVNCY